jgi:choloylglycine hydrolase
MKQASFYKNANIHENNFIRVLSGKSKTNYLWMKRIVLSVVFGILFLLAGFFVSCIPDKFYQSKNETGCSTFLINKNDSIVVGHNLDEYLEMPGAVFINKRGVIKENRSWSDILCLCLKKKSIPRIQWVSKYGSVTYSYWGKDFIDGGMNEVGLYIGEMTLLGSKWLKSENPPFHHHLFMQYVLDNFTTVPEVIEAMDKIHIDGHCQWHYFIADKLGNTAIFEFINDSLIIFQDNKMPVQVLCNRAYEKELKLIPDNDSVYNQMLEKDYVKRDLRFMLASKMINEYNSSPTMPIVDYSFSILKKMDMGNNKWSVVYDVKNLRMYFRTSIGKDVKYIDFASFDFSCSTPVKVLDIHSDGSGDVAEKFVNYSEDLNKQLIHNGFKNMNFGFIGNILLKPNYKNKLNIYANSFKCEH